MLVFKMVLLGFLDEPKGGKIGEDDDPTNWTISRIGGQPAFPNEAIAVQVKTTCLCAKCQKEQVFVCQLYCPLQGHKYDRTLYLFACRNPSCWNSSNSWTVLRCQKFDETVEESAPIIEQSSTTIPTDWCDDADAWNSDDDDDGDEENKKQQPSSVPKTVKKEAEVVMFDSMKIEDEKSSSDEDDQIETETKKKPNKKNVSVASADAFNEWKKNNLTPQMSDLSTEVLFPFYYIVIDDEEEIVNEAKLYEQKKLKNKMKKFDDIDEDEADETAKGGKEKYEKTPDIEHGDVVFYKFQQKIRYAPEQIIRYDWSGHPLILRKFDSNALSSVQRCRHCQSSCVFEFQLMPALVNFLKIDNQIGLEFGTVFVYTCSNNCWKNDDLYRLENVFVQADPDQNLFD